MENNLLDKKYSLKSLLEEYQRIEIPILQRDYAQGRKDKKTNKIRKDITDYILESLDKNEPRELDFVYGAVRNYLDKQGNSRQAFIPLDGQQRLTTLWLLYWYLAYRNYIKKEDREFLNKMLERFTYENRTSSKDFMKALCLYDIPQTFNISYYIINDTDWFDEAWLLDPSVSGFLTMLSTFEKHPIVNKPGNITRLYDNLVKENLITFYFLPLKNFGLGEEIYTRMNARGKILNDFEVFKSNFYKIIDESPLKEDITKKIEYNWVKNLWPYRGENIYVTDIPFMNWLRYITKMLYVFNPSAELVDAEDEKIDYLSFEILKKIYSDENNLRFIVHSFDGIPDMVSFPTDICLNWKKDEVGLEPTIKEILTKPKYDDAANSIIIFEVLKFMELRKNSDGTVNFKGLDDYIRVIRNLIENTYDRSKREWPKILRSLENLISENVYIKIQELQANDLQGLRVEQRNIELLKAQVIYQKHNSSETYYFNEEAYKIFVRMDDDSAIRARETNFLIELYNYNKSDNHIAEIKELKAEDIDITALNKLYDSYCALKNYGEESDFRGIWGDLFPTEIYREYDYAVVWDDGDMEHKYYRVCPTIVRLAIEVMQNNSDVEDTILKRQKQHIRQYIKDAGGDLANLLSPKSQLYILYIATIRRIGVRFDSSNIWTFFAWRRLNFGWVPKENNFSTPFTHLISESRTSKIYQTFNSYLKNDYVISGRTPLILNVGQRKNNFLEIIAGWANS